MGETTKKMIENDWLVVWNMTFIFHNIIYGIILPID